MKRHFVIALLCVFACKVTVLASTVGGGKVLEGRGIRLAFATADRGFGCLEVENRLGETPVLFCADKAQDGTRLWELCFWRDGDPTNGIVTIDSRSPCQRRFVTDEAKALRFAWEGLSPDGEDGAVDVYATVSLTDGGDAAEWRLEVKNRSDRLGLAQTEYPIFEHVVKPGVATALFPLGGLGGRVVKKCKRGFKMRYPSGSVPVQTLAYMVGDAGLQVTALDGNAQEKTFCTTNLSASVIYRCPDCGVPGTANAPDFAVETAAFKGDWWRAAKRYRAWAIRQKWTAKGPLVRRKDFCRRFADTGIVMNIDRSPDVLTNVMAKALAAAGDVPLCLHWYCWHKIPFDHSYPEFFPAKVGAHEASEWMRSRGVFVMPYINGRLWDSAIPTFTNAYPAACKKPDGKSLYIERYARKRPTVPMCPTTDLWRRKLDVICDRLMDEIGVDAIYFDQIGQAEPAPCFDASHGHPLGGGKWWTHGYRELLRPIREKASARGVGMTCECTAEPYIDSVDGFLSWFARTPEEVPLLPAVYSGYAIYFGTPQSPEDDFDARCVFQGREFLWGILAGWNLPFTNEKFAEHRDFVLRLSRERLAHKDFMVYGELLGELPVPAEVPRMDVKFNRKPGFSLHAPAVMGTVWKSLDGRLAAFLVNASGEPQKYALNAEGFRSRLVEMSPRSVMTILAEDDQ